MARAIPVPLRLLTVNLKIKREMNFLTFLLRRNAHANETRADAPHEQRKEYELLGAL